MSKMFLSKGWVGTESVPKKYWYILGIVAGILLLGIGLLWGFSGSLGKEETSAALEMIGEPLTIEVVDTHEARAQGLSGRTEIEEGYGMLFVFDEKDRHGFWMKDMHISIDIFWLADDGTILHVAEQVGPETYSTDLSKAKIFYPDMPARYVLETRAGHARALGLSVGDRMPGILLSEYAR